MSFVQIIVLALVQGITEFLPISSEGHNILVPYLTGWPDQGKLFDAMTNFGTLGALVVYFWRDVLSILRGLVDAARGERSASSRLMVNVAIATVPIVIIGLVLEATHLIDHFRSPTLIAINAIVFGALLYVCDAYGLAVRKMSDMNWKTSLIIGSAQALALSPGTSRSGITMTAGRGLGFIRSEAARFSFLCGIPANAAASFYVVGKALAKHEPISLAAVFCTILTFFVALGTITILMQLIRRISFLPFAAYRILLGAVLLALIYSGTPLGAVN